MYFLHLTKFFCTESVSSERGGAIAMAGNIGTHCQLCYVYRVSEFCHVLTEEIGSLRVSVMIDMRRWAI